MSYTYYKRYRNPRKGSGFGSFLFFVGVILLLLLLIWGARILISRFTNDPRDEATLSVEQGSGELLVWGTQDSVPLSSTQFFYEGDEVMTDDSSLVSIEFYEGLTVTLDENTRLSFTQVIDEEGSMTLILNLIGGRAFIHQVQTNDEFLYLICKTDVISVESLEGDFLVTNIPNQEAVYDFKGQLKVLFFDAQDPSKEPITIDEMSLNSGDSIVLSDAGVTALLDRTGVVLVESFEAESFGQDSFIRWNWGDQLLPPKKNQPSQLELIR